MSVLCQRVPPWLTLGTVAGNLRPKARILRDRPKKPDVCQDLQRIPIIHQGSWQNSQGREQCLGYEPVRAAQNKCAMGDTEVQLLAVQFCRDNMLPQVSELDSKIDANLLLKLALRNHWMYDTRNLGIE